MNTSSRDSCRHHFEYVKQTRPFTEREYMQCSKCGHQNPLGLFQHWDTERDGTPVFAKYSDNTGPGRNIKKGRSSGPHLQWVKNTTGKIEDIITREEWDKANPPLSQPKKGFFDHRIDAFKAPFKPQPKRQPITKLRRIWRGPNPITGQTFSTWYWQCALCDHNMKARETGDTHYGELCFTWETAYRRATHHAHNHH